MKLRSLIFWPHLVAGVLAGLVILLMSVTGVLLTYERQLIAWADSHHQSAPPADGGGRLPLEALLAEFARQRPGAEPTAVTVGAEPEAPVVIAVEGGTVYADAYSGAVLGDGAQGMRRFMSELRAWHRWLAMEGDERATARAVTGWANVLFAVLVTSGLYLWMPREWRWSHLKPILLFRGAATSRARDFNWHNVLGFWSAVPLFIVVVSAVPISFPWASAAIYRAVGEEPPAGRGGGGARGGGERGRGGRDRQAAGVERQGDAARTERGAGRPDGAVATAGIDTTGLNTLLARAERRVAGWQTINVRLPASIDAPIVFAIDRGDGGQPHLRSTLTVDRITGAEVSYEDFSALTAGRQIRSILRFAHTGEVLGLAGQTIAGLVSAVGVVLVWTGLALAWRRFRAWSARIVRRASTASSSSSPSSAV